MFYIFLKIWRCLMRSAGLGFGIITSLDRMSLDNKLIEVYKEAETKQRLIGRNAYEG